MEFIHRKISLSRYMVPFDSNNDGVSDSLTLTATTKSLIIPLTQSYDDMGVFEVLNGDDQNTIDVIDVSGIWDESNNGLGDITTIGNGDFGIDWGDGVSSGTNTGGLNISNGCIDPSALNFSQTLYDLSVLSPPTTIVNNVGCVYPNGSVFGSTGTNVFVTLYSNDCPDISDNDDKCGGCAPLGGFGSPPPNGDNDLWVSVPWSVYSLGDAITVANQRCQQVFGATSGVRDISDFTAAELTSQGDCSNSVPFPGIKLRNTEQDTCCHNPSQLFGCTPGSTITLYRHEFCFWCKN